MPTVKLKWAPLTSTPIFLILKHKKSNVTLKFFVVLTLQDVQIYLFLWILDMDGLLGMWGPWIRFIYNWFTHLDLKASYQVMA